MKVGDFILVDDIEMNLIEIGLGCCGLDDMAQDRDKWRALVNTVLKIRVS
jgi:hypothetical protein